MSFTRLHEHTQSDTQTLANDPSSTSLLEPVPMATGLATSSPDVCAALHITSLPVPLRDFKLPRGQRPHPEPALCSFTHSKPYSLAFSHPDAEHTNVMDLQLQT